MVIWSGGMFMRSRLSRPARPLATSWRVALLASLTLLSACASGPGTSVPDAASDEEWRALAEPRPAPLAGAARVSVTGVEIAGSLPWEQALPMSPELAIEELVVAGLLRRRDVHFVERRRFTAAAEAERAGVSRPTRAPAAGISPGAEYVASAAWVAVPGTDNTIEVRLTDARRGDVVATQRATVPNDAPPLAVARSTVGAILGALDDLGRRPAWEDPIGFSDGTTSGPSNAGARVGTFLRGVSAESAWRWESARRFYSSAAEAPGFFEASAALARAARLRNGGTLGES